MAAETTCFKLLRTFKAVFRMNYCSPTEIARNRIKCLVSGKIELPPAETDSTVEVIR